jgi:mannose-6-phosphate isomerase
MNSTTFHLRRIGSLAKDRRMNGNASTAKHRANAGARGVLKLRPHQVEKPWGRTNIPAVFGPTNGNRIGEIWFEHPGGEELPLLTKYIFTSERLSVQVHPGDDEAQKRGFDRGKSECWYILDADPGATLGLGLTSALTARELRSAALDGSIEELMDWRPIAPGDFYYVPPGTIHAIGAGVSLLEFQQNADLTYRLYDYGRPRELHLDDAVAVSRPGPYREHYAPPSAAGIDGILVDGPNFSLARASATSRLLSALEGRLRWVMPLEGTVISGDETAAAGECLLLRPSVPLELGGNAVALIGIEGGISSELPL